MNANFEFITSLQYKVKSLTARVEAFESGEKYTDLKTACKTQLAAKDREIKRLKRELADSNSKLVTMREYWWQVYEDMEKSQLKEQIRDWLLIFSQRVPVF